MSPASRSKSKDKKAGKEPHKASSKPSGLLNTNGGIPASGYNPLLGTFHTFETSPVLSTSPIHVNGRFRNIDDTEDHNTGMEYDSISNNDSWSGESEDHKEKTSQSLPRQEIVPGADNDKREKIRQKNEKKHQRQKEKRAQELHERCSGYLMSRKLEALSHQLMAMGISQERATMALILNEGRVEESIAWLFEGAEEDKHREKHNFDSGGNLKIDITKELTRIDDMEVKYKASKQEVERAIVACEGDLEKAEETLKSQKQEPPAIPVKPVENFDPPAIISNGKQPIAINQITMRVQTKPTASTIIQQKRDERDFNYPKIPVTVTGPSLDPSIKSMQKIPPKPEWAKQQQHISASAEKRQPNQGSNPSVSYSLASPLQAAPPPAKTESRFTSVAHELKNLQLGSVREPVIVMQRPQSINNSKQAHNSNISSSPSGSTMHWFPNSNVDTMKPNGYAPPVSVSRILTPNDVGSYPMYNQHHHQSQQFMSSSGSIDSLGNTMRGNNNGMWSKGGASPILAPPSSLGLFTGIGGASGLAGSSSPVDWSTGSSMVQFDYSSIDWSLDLGSLTSRSNGLWNGSNYSMQNNEQMYDSFSYGLGVRSGTKSVMSNGGSVPGLHQDGVGSSEMNGGGSRDWTSPFEEKDIFSLSRRFVSSPTL